MAPVEIPHAECVELISAAEVGRLAICTSNGPQIFPLNFVVVESTILLRTSPYTALGTALTSRPRAAFEVDSIDVDHQRGWSVVAHGRVEPVDDPDDIRHLLEHGSPTPWAGGSRSLYATLRWDIISGRRVGAW